MIIIPTIELQAGRCVSLKRGDLNAPQIWHVDPVKAAMDFANAGAHWMHVTDFDAVAGRGDNAALIEDIILRAGIPVQVAGGVGSSERLEHWIGAGAGRVVMGSVAVRDPLFVKHAAKLYPDQIVLAVDVFRGRVMVDGWQVESAYEATEFVSLFNSDPLGGVIVTDIESDIGDGDGSLATVSAIANVARTPVISSGVVRTADDISRLKYLGNISGAIVGRALFNKSADLPELLQLATPAPENIAAFI